MFETRSMLDIMDGVIYRAQSKVKAVLSGWGTWGYMIDGVADTTGSLFIMFGVLWRFNKNPPLKSTPSSSRLYNYQPLTSTTEDDSTTTSKEHITERTDDSWFDEAEVGARERHSQTKVNLNMLFIALAIGLRGALWDHFVHNYHTVMAVRRADVDVKYQFDILHSTTTWFCLWLWKFNSADAFLTYTLIAIFFDRTWRWMRFWLYATIPNLLVLGLICNFHLMYVRAQLGIQ